MDLVIPNTTMYRLNNEEAIRPTPPKGVEAF